MPINCKHMYHLWHRMQKLSNISQVPSGCEKVWLLNTNLCYALFSGLQEPPGEPLSAQQNLTICAVYVIRPDQITPTWTSGDLWRPLKTA